MPPFIVSPSTGQAHKSVSSCTIPLPQLTFLQGHIMLNLNHNLMVIGPLCDKVCSIIYEKAAFKVLSSTREVILCGWQEVRSARLWRFSLLPNSQPQPPAQTSPVPKANSAHNIPSVAALIIYLHAASWFPVKSTLLSAINAVNYSSWLGLTPTYATKYCPNSD